MSIMATSALITITPIMAITPITVITGTAAPTVITVISDRTPPIELTAAITITAEMTEIMVMSAATTAIIKGL
jgi:hypothetical protein